MFNLNKLRVDFILNLNYVLELIYSFLAFNDQFQFMGNITRSWPRRPSPFPAAEKDQNAAAAPDAMKVSA
jgi:hypothetical protein